MNKVQPRRPSGFGEYLPAEQIEFDRLLTIIRETYKKYGFTPIDTPDLELTEVLLAKGGGETEQQVYSFKREGSDTDLTLRYDLTVPLARYVSEHQNDLVFPFSRYHIGKVHRAERAQAGRFREFYQCDIDTIGSESPVVDAQFPAIINEIFSQFHFGEFTIRLNNRLILNGFFEGIGLKDVSRDVLRTIDKMEKITREALIEELKKIGLSDEQVERVLEFTDIKGSNDEILERLQQLGIESEQFNDGITKLSALIHALRDMEVPEPRFQIDLRIARGLDYYTGTVYETVLNDHPEVGSVCSGGRYDDLASFYTSAKLPGVGISIGLTRLFYALRQNGIITADQQSPADVVVIPLNESHYGFALRFANTLRTAGVATTVNTEVSDLGKRLRYASRMGFPYAVVIGDEEASSGTVSVKNMVAETSQTLSVHEAIQTLSQH
jgi:histidyl-tRNA synthetase